MMDSEATVVTMVGRRGVEVVKSVATTMVT
jgi:hypothetical protein